MKTIEKIEKARKEKGYSAYKLCKLAGIRESAYSAISHVAIVRIESGKRNPLKPTLKAIAQALNLDPQTLEPAQEKSCKTCKSYDPIRDGEPWCSQLFLRKTVNSWNPGNFYCKYYYPGDG